MKKVIALCLLTLYSIPCYAQSAVDSGIGFHPFRHMLSKMEGTALAGAAGYGAYRYNQAGRDELNQVTYSATVSYGTPQGDYYKQQIASILQHHKIMGKPNLAKITAQIVSQEPQYKEKATSLLNYFGLPPTILDKLIPRDRNQNIQNIADENEKINSIEAEEEKCEIDSGAERNKMGIATGGYDLPYITDNTKWFHGTGMQIALIPRQVADNLRGHVYQNFDGLRSDIWEQIYENKVMRNYFVSYNKANNKMEYGYAPFVKNGQNVSGSQSRSNIKEISDLWNYSEKTERKENNSNITNVPDTKTMSNGSAMTGNTRYQIHHIIPIGRGGKVYDFDNLAIVTPLYHCSMLDYNYHQGGGKRK